MAKTKKKIRKSRQLILGYLESVSTEVFSNFPKALTDLVGKEHGVYALYKLGHLYYIGLATNLRNRIKNHLRDKHAGKWDSLTSSGENAPGMPMRLLMHSILCKKYSDESFMVLLQLTNAHAIA